MRAAGLVAGVVAQLEELLDVRVPRLDVHAGRALAPAALIHGRHRRVERLQPRHDAVGLAVRARDQRPTRAHAVIREADAAARTSTASRRRCTAGRCSSRSSVGRVEQEAARQLLVHRAGVEQRRRARARIRATRIARRARAPPARFCASAQAMRMKNCCGVSSARRVCGCFSR